jgi:hypothetical protein
MIAALGGKVVAPDQSSGGLGLERPIWRTGQVDAPGIVSLANLTNLLPKQVKGAKVQTEQMFSGLHTKQTQGVYERRTAKHAAMERVKDAFS